MWHDHLMYVVTIDQRDSRSTADRVPGLLAALEPIPCAAPFERTAGDEVQGLVEQPAAVRQVLLTALRGGHWHCGVGIGPVDPGSWKAGTRAGRAPSPCGARRTRARPRAGGPPTARQCGPWSPPSCWTARTRSGGWSTPWTPPTRRLRPPPPWTSPPPP